MTAAFGIFSSIFLEQYVHSGGDDGDDKHEADPLPVSDALPPFALPPFAPCFACTFRVSAWLTVSSSASLPDDDGSDSSLDSLALDAMLTACRVQLTTTDSRSLRGGGVNFDTPF